MPRAAVPPPIRLALILSAALFSAYGTFVFRSLPHPYPSDFWVVWQGARDLWHHTDPYTAIGTSQPFPTRLLYPLPALLAIAPLAWLPIRLVDPVVVGGAAAIFAWWGTRDGYGPGLLLFVSIPWRSVMQTGQVWDAGALLAVGVPWCGFLLAVKPTLGAAVWLARPSVTSAGVAAGAVAVSLLLWPAWVPAWRAAVATAGHFQIVLLEPGGVVLLLAAVAWRDWRARLLLALACIPQTLVLYSVAILFVIPRTWPEGAILFGLSCVAAWQIDRMAHYALLDAYTAWSAPWLLVCCYFPCLVMVLRDHRHDTLTR